MKLRVALLPAEPADGSESMWRYWHEVRSGIAAVAAESIEVIEPFAPAGAPCRLGRWARGWRKYVAYPSGVVRMPRADVYHLLDHGFAHVLRRVPPDARVMATVHDLAPLTGDEGLTAGQVRRFRRAMQHLLSAERLVVPSKFVAATLARELRVAKEKISVVPMGVNLARFTPTVAAAPASYVLSIGSALPRKNLAVLPAIMGRLEREVPGVRLVRLGEPLPSEVRREVEAVLPGRVEERGRVDDRELTHTYAQALALLLPSRLEGFGLPVLEAMAAGCPVVCSDAASLPEAGGEAALYFAPDDAAAAARHVARLAMEPGYRAATIAAGRERARLFPWAAHVAELVSLYRRLAER